MDPTEYDDFHNLSRYPDARFSMSSSAPGDSLYSSTNTRYGFQPSTASSANPRYSFQTPTELLGGNAFLSANNAGYASGSTNPGSDNPLHRLQLANDPSFSPVDTPVDSSFSPPPGNDYALSSSPPFAPTNTTTSRTGANPSSSSRRRSSRVASSPSPGPSTTLSGGITKSRPSTSGGKHNTHLREKRTLIPITDEMTPEEKAAAKQENYRLRNGDSAAKSRIRKTMAVVEGALAARGYAADVEMLMDLLGESERVMSSYGMGAAWDAVKKGVLERYGKVPEVGKGIGEVLFRRDEGVLGLLADPEEARRELEGKVVSGELVVHGLAFADAVARLVGKETGDVPTYRMVVAKQELRERIAAAAKAREEGRREVESLRERLETKLKKVQKADEEMPALRATAVRYGQEDYFSSCFGKGAGGIGDDVMDVAVVDQQNSAPAAELDSTTQAGVPTLPTPEPQGGADFKSLLPDPMATDDFSTTELQAEGWFQGTEQYQGGYNDLGDFVGWPGGDTVDPQLLQLPGDGEFRLP
ncbi:hypothetical protein QBC34DRAFT_473532 [Podospora aff. communis PSN243]|uniref:BZIP domain-containing protein n=1 Tax=Podospora aff. communis PSN243 TaxID=3040156 RepID=A0AAV9G9Y3_9PEZI|nr:hypothetical protein QBC34DRAFT_473532 [Podospora aff. communis PSN243]